MLVIVGGGAFLIGLCTLRAIRSQTSFIARQTLATRRAAEATEDAAIATDSAAKAARISADAAKDTLATNQEIERAYITFGHRDVVANYETSPDGQGGWTTHLDKPTSIDVIISVTNVGRTPGDVLGGFIGYRVSKEPGPPDGLRVLKRFDVGFLLPRKHFSLNTSIQEDRSAAEQQRIADILMGKGNIALWLVGEIDYEDRFGGLHTCGYGRVLIFNDANPRQPTFQMSPSIGKFNFDRPMTDAKRQHYGKKKGHDAPS